MQSSFAIVQRAADDEEPVLDKPVHERRMLVPAILGPDRTRGIPPGTVHQRYREVRHSQTLMSTADICGSGPRLRVCGMRRYRAGTMAVPRGGCMAPVTRVFSLYVALAGSAWPRGAGRPAPAAFNRAGEKLQATGGELPRVWAEAGPQREDGLALPLIGEEGQGAPAAVRADRCAGQAASGWQAAAPEATAASQLVPWTTME